VNKYARKNIDIILKNEGGFQNDIDDYGNFSKVFNEDCKCRLDYMSDNCRTCKKCLIGTNRGIAARWFAKMYDIRTMTLNDAANCYFYHFWIPQNVMFIAKNGNEEFILQLFDFGINTSIRHSNKTLQRLIGAYPDGFLGKETLQKLNDYQGDILEDFKHARKVWYEYISQKRNNAKYLNGWLLRIDHTTFK